jgi:hypothetical protein
MCLFMSISKISQRKQTELREYILTHNYYYYYEFYYGVYN